MEFDPKDIVYSGQRFAPPKRLEPQVDLLVSDIVGQKVYSTDPRLIKVVIDFKKNNPGDRFDNNTSNPAFIKALREAFSKPL